MTRLPLSSRSLRDGGVVFVPLRDEGIAIALVTNPAAATAGARASSATCCAR